MLFTEGIRVVQRANSRSREHSGCHKHLNCLQLDGRQPFPGLITQAWRRQTCQQWAGPPVLYLLQRLGVSKAEEYFGEVI